MAQVIQAKEDDCSDMGQDKKWSQKTKWEMKQTTGQNIHLYANTFPFCQAPQSYFVLILLIIYHSTGLTYIRPVKVSSTSS